MASPAPKDSVAFDIPAQSLSKSLQEFSLASGLEVLVDARQTAHAAAPAVKGTMPPRSALFILLQNASLAPEQLVSGAFVLNAVQAPSTRLPGDKQPYFSDVQRAFQAALCAEGLISSRRYRLALKFWVGASGDVARAERLDTTGDDRLDNAIDAVISRVRIGKGPPANLDQPIALIISPGDMREATCMAGPTPLTSPALP